MAERHSKATLSKGRSGWCVIYRHPVCRTTDGRDRLRIRRGLATRDEGEALGLVEQLNEILADTEMWTPAARVRADVRYAPQVVSAFYDYLTPEASSAWDERELALPLPSAAQGYARALLVGTTGAGKTTIVRQLLGTDPDRERFPSTSAAKTTICDLEMIFAPGPFRAVVSFMPKEQARQYVSDCVNAAVARRIQRASRSELTRRFLEHTDQQFRIGYILGMPRQRGGSADELKDETEDEPMFDEASLVSQAEREDMANRLEEILDSICSLADEIAGAVAEALGTSVDLIGAKDLDAFEECVEEELLKHESFHELVDEIMDEIEERFSHLSVGELKRARDDWPTAWAWTCDTRETFIREVNRFSSNYAPNFGRLLTPLVEGIRVAGPFDPDWRPATMPKLALLDGRGIGHTADSSSSVSTTITRRFQVADAILLVDSAAQPMQAAPCAVLRSLVASGHESKLIMCFTHFDEVKGDNLLDQTAKKHHVLASVDNAINAVGKTLGRDAEHALRRLLPDRVVFLANIQRRLNEKARFTVAELGRLLSMIGAAAVPPAPIEFKPVFDVANLVLAIQRAAQEFHDAWKGVLGFGTRSGTAPEHWSRVKALTRHVGLLSRDEYDTLRPVADLIRFLQTHISQFLAQPFSWLPGIPPESEIDQRLAAIDEIKKRVFSRLHELSTRRLLAERISGWVEAFDHRGPGSTRVRAREIVNLYESAAPIPNEMPGPDANEFLFEIRELVAESIRDCGGEVRGWTRVADLTEGVNP